MTIDKTWTLFLDRDGVINNLIEDGYVKSWEHFEFLPGVLEAIRLLSQIFGKIVIVTNQRGISRKLMTTEDMDEIHSLMLKEIKDAGGRIDKIYYCPHLVEDDCDCRKPKTGMPLQAKKDFPGIDFSKSVIAGDSQNDMEMGQRLGMTTVFIGTSIVTLSGPVVSGAEPVEVCYDSLISFAREINESGQ